MLRGIVAMLDAVLDGQSAEPELRHRLMLAEYGNTVNRLVEIAPDGQLVWEHRPPSITVIFEMLPNGHILYAFGGKPTGVREIGRDQSVIWEWMSGCPQVLGMSLLSNGDVLAGEQGGLAGRSRSRCATALSERFP
jgi:hypothetical protein